MAGEEVRRKIIGDGVTFWATGDGRGPRYAGHEAKMREERIPMAVAILRYERDVGS